MIHFYWIQFKTYVALHFQYRAGVLIWLIGIVLKPIIYLMAWVAVAKSKGGQVGGYHASEFVTYYIALMLVGHMTYTWVMWQYSDRIRQGTLSSMLLMPVHPIHRDILENFSFKVVALIAIIPATILLWFIFQPEFHFSTLGVSQFCFVLLLAIILRFGFEWTLGIFAFWLTRNSAVSQIYFLCLFFLSGQVAPVALLPSSFQTLALCSPFYLSLGFPVEVLMGRLSDADFLRGIVLQCCWIGGIAVMASVLWQAGLRRYSAVGS
jgi:ABC-2 type transport system permease protein